jgi:hypothetical protein
MVDFESERFSAIFSQKNEPPTLDKIAKLGFTYARAQSILKNLQMKHPQLLNYGLKKVTERLNKVIGNYTGDETDDLEIVKHAEILVSEHEHRKIKGICREKNWGREQLDFEKMAYGNYRLLPKSDSVAKGLKKELEKRK